MNDREFIDSRIFIDGAARFDDLLYVLSKDKQLQEDDVSHSSVVGVDQGKWTNADDTPWDSTAIAVARQPKEKLVLVGEDGQVLTYVGGKSTEE